MNNDQSISPLDALIGINVLNGRSGSATLPARPADATDSYVDVNGDGIHSPLDVLIVINSLNGGFQVSSGLQNDTGFGPNAGADHLTSDASISGTTRAPVDYLDVQINQQGPWHSIRDLQRTDGSFVIPQSTLQALAGGQLPDGEYSIDIRAGQNTPGPSAVPDRNVFHFGLKRFTVGDILMPTPDRIVVPLAAPLNASAFSHAQVHLFDITWGENASVQEFGLDGEYPRFELAPTSVTLADDGRAIVIEPPANTRSIKYLIEYSGTFQDAAGNTAILPTVRANYFSPDVPQLQPGELVATPLNQQARVLEYSLQFDQNDVLVWSGNQSVQSRSRIELYDVHGQMLYRTEPWVGGAAYIGQPAMWPVEAGKYRLRVVDPPVNQNEFRILRLSDVPELPAIHETQGEYWKTDLYQVRLVPDERITFVGSNPDVPAVASVIDPLGQVVQLTDNGSGGQLLQAESSGVYLIAAHRAPFTSQKGSDEYRHPTSQPVITGQLDNVGDRLFASFATTPGMVYLLDVEHMSGDLKLWSLITTTTRGLEVANNQWMFTASDTAEQIFVERVRSSTAAADFSLRLTPLTNIQPLPMNAPIPSPSVGQALYYYLESPPVDNSLLLDGAQQFLVLRTDIMGFVLRQTGPVTVSHITSGGLLIRVQAESETGPWIARSVETIEQPLKLSVPTQLNFEHGLERFELETQGELGQFLQLSPRSGDITNYAVTLLDPSGQPVKPLSVGSTSLWQLHFSGPHRLVVAGRGVPSIGQLTVQVSSQAQWPMLEVETLQSLHSAQQFIYRLPGGMSHYYLDAVAAPSGSSWSIINQRGIPIADQPLFKPENFQLQDFEPALPAADDHYLIVDVAKSTGDQQLVFRLRADVEEVRRVALGDDVQGTLVSGGDRVRLQWNLQRGQLVQWSRLSYDAGDVQARWYAADNVQQPDLSKPYLVPVDGIYELVLLNRGPTSEAYSVTLSAAANTALGAGLDGFNTVFDGVVEGWSNREIATLRVEANTIGIVDWLGSEGNTDVHLLIRKPTGEVVLDQLGVDARLELREAGAYQLAVSNTRQQSQAYRFILRDLASAPAVPIGQPFSDTVAPYEFRLYRAVLPVASELTLVNNVPGWTAGMISAQPGGQTGMTYAAGDVAVLVDNNTSAPRAIDYTIQPTDSRPLLAVNGVTNVLLVGSQTVFRLDISAPQTVRVNLADLGVIVVDPSGVEVQREENVFKLPTAGEYRLIVLKSPDQPPLKTTIQLQTLVPAAIEYTLGTPIQSSIGPSEVHSYHFSVRESSLFLFNLNSILSFDTSDVELVDSAGRQLNLYTSIPSQYLSSTTVQELTAGEYTLRIRSSQAKSYTLQIDDLNAAPVIAPGRLHSSLGESEFSRVYRVDLRAGESLRLRQGWENTAFLLTYMNSDQHEQHFRQFVDATGDSEGQTLYLIAVGRGSVIDVNLELKARVESDVAADATIEGSLAGDEAHLIHFSIDSPNVVFNFESQFANATLLTPFGTRIPLPQHPVSILPSGNYTLEIATYLAPTSYRFSYQVLDTAPTITSAGATLTSGTYYRLELPQGFKGRQEVLDAEGHTLPLYLVQFWKQGMNAPELFDFRNLAAGTYWVRAVADPGQQATYQLRLVPLAPTTTSTAQVGKFVTINLASEYSLHRVKMEVPAGKPVLFSQWNLPEGVTARLRHTSHLLGDERGNPFGSLDASIHYVWATDGMLELEFEGSGLVNFQLISLDDAPVLAPGELMSFSLDGSKKHAAWRIPVDQQKTLLWERLRPDASAVNWQLLDASGNLVTDLHQGELLSIVNTAPLYLVASRTLISSDAVQLEIAITSV